MDHTGVRAALARVMAQNVTFPGLLQESEEQITKETIVEQIEKKSKSWGIPASVVASDMVFCHLRSLADNTTNKQQNWSEHKEFADTIEYLVERKILVPMELERKLLQEPLFFSLPLPAIWRMCSTKVISLEQVIKRIYERFNGKSSYLVNGLLSLILHERGQDMQQPAGDVLAMLVDLMFSPSRSLSQEWVSLTKFAGEVLQGVTEGVLDAVLGGNAKVKSQTVEEEKQSDETSKGAKDVAGGIVNMYQLVLENPRVTQEALEGYFSSQLVQVLTHRPNIKLTKVLKKQEMWCYSKANPVLIVLLQKLVVGLGHEETFKILELVLSNEEVNWGCVLTLVATALTSHRSCATKLKELIERNIRRGCEELEVESMVVGFLFARHAAHEGQHLFPSYAQWFSSLFNSEATSPAAQKQSFVFLFRFMTEMVPHEPAHCLRAHLTAHIFTPRGCHEILQSYNHLARARLQELNDAPLDHKDRLSPKAKAIEDVERAIKQFSDTGKVPGFVSECSIFRETYFRTSFLPALLAPRHLPEVPDARAKLIEELSGRGKITAAMMKNYVEACQKESSELLQGVFMDVQEDIVMEEPITELSNLLENLININSKQNGSDGGDMAACDVLPLLSKISRKIEEMMKSYDANLKDVKHITLDSRFYDDKLLSSQIVESVFRCVGSLLVPQDTETNDTKKEEEGVRTGLISQLLSLISSSPTLQRSLSLLLGHRLSLQHITQQQLKTDGVVMFELSKIEGLFLSVVEATQPNQTPCTVTQHYLNNLPLDTPKDLNNVCCVLSSWLEWHIQCEEKTASVRPHQQQLLHLYLSIAPRLPLLLSRNEGSEASTADVYNYLNGCGVPECCRLYFSDDLKDMICKIPLLAWVHFEMRASWGNVPVDVRQTFLYTQLVSKVSPRRTSTQSHQSQEHQSPDHFADDLLPALVMTLIEEGLRKRNASDMLMLVQTAGQYHGEAEECLLEAWHKGFKTGYMDTTKTLSFMSICRCVSPSFFLKSDKLLELAEVLQTYVRVLQSGLDIIQLSLCDTTFLCVCLLTAAANPVVKNLQVELCLKSIKPAVLFHWDSMKNFFKSYWNTVIKHQSLNSLYLTLEEDISNQVSLLGEEEAGIRLLSISLEKGVCDAPIDVIACPNKNVNYVKWLLAYIGLEQVRGYIPYLLREEEKLNVSELNMNIILLSCKEIINVIKTKNSFEVIEDLFPAEDETLLGLRLVPVAFIFVVMGVKEGHFNSDIVTTPYEISLMEIILQCNNLLCCTFDEQNNGDDNSNLSRKNFPRKRWLPDLDYLSQLHHKILSYLCTSSPLVISKINKNTLLKLDPEIKAAAYNRLVSKKKC